MNLEIMKKIALIIPAYQPSEKLGNLVEQVQKLDFSQIIIVDDGSGPDYDDLFQTIEKIPDTKVIHHDRNKGKGSALKTGIYYIEEKCPYIDGMVTADADGQHRIEDIEKIRNVLSNEYSGRKIVLGVRCFSDKGINIPLRSRIGNKITQWILRLCAIDIKDTQTGLRGFPNSTFRKLLEISGEGYEYETNVLLELSGTHSEKTYELLEVPIETVYIEDNSSSHFRPIVDSARIYSFILKYMLSSFICALLDYIIFLLCRPWIKNLVIITFLGRGISAAANFTINRNFVFRDRGDILATLVKYILLLLTSGMLSVIGQSYFNKLLFSNNSMPSLFVKVVVESVLYIFNFLIQKYLIFVPEKNIESRD